MSKKELREIPSFDVSKKDMAVIQKISQRAVKAARSVGVPYEVLDIVMDLTATHANGCPLRLSALLLAKAQDFNHDIFGIRWELDRSTGHLANHFVPRYATKEAR